jgi:hypothetical protein
MRPDRRSTGNHPGIVDYKGGSYVFGFNFKLNFAITEQHHERRSVCVAKMTYNPDGTIEELPWWEEAASVEQIEPLNPYVRTEAETICWSEGMKSEPCSEGGMSVYPTRDGAYIKVKGVDFGNKGAVSFEARVASETDGGILEIHLDGPTGPLAKTCTVPDTGGLQTWTTIDCPIDGIVGVYDLYFTFRGGSEKRFNVNWWQFK